MPTRDRLAELRQAAGVEEGVYHTTVETSTSPSTEADDIQQIFREVERMRGWIHDLDGTTQLLRRLHSDPTFHNNKQLQEQSESAAAQWSAGALQVVGALRALEERAARARCRGDARSRITRLQYACTRALYADALARHHAALAALRDRHRALIQQQLALTNVSVSEEECERLLESPDLSVFVDNVRADTAAARRALRDVEARREELARVEAALHDVRDLFTHLAHLVAAQQEQLDTVEYFALQATEHVESGGQHLLKGTVSRRKANKKKWSVIVCLSAGFLVVLLVLVFT